MRVLTGDHTANKQKYHPVVLIYTPEKWLHLWQLYALVSLFLSSVSEQSSVHITEICICAVILLATNHFKFSV